MKKFLNSFRRLFPVFLLLMGAGMMAVGIFIRNEHLMVLNKAIKICMECIGLG